MDQTEKRMSSVELSVIDLEARSRRNNLIFLNIPEPAQETDAGCERALVSFHVKSLQVPEVDQCPPCCFSTGPPTWSLSEMGCPRWPTLETAPHHRRVQRLSNTTRNLPISTKVPGGGILHSRRLSRRNPIRSWTVMGRLQKTKADGLRAKITCTLLNCSLRDN